MLNDLISRPARKIFPEMSHFDVTVEKTGAVKKYEFFLRCQALTQRRHWSQSRAEQLL